MRVKPITVITVLLLVVASLLVSGCTTSTTSNTNQTPSASTATHDAFLEKYLGVFKNQTYSDKNQTVKAYEVSWTNSTSAREELTTLNKTTNRTVNGVFTDMIFPTTQDATQYLNGMNKTAYSLGSTQYSSGGAYQKTTGHAPTVYKYYEWNEGNPFNISEYKQHAIQQLDNIIIISTGKFLTT
jgi:outer membrane lipoprotein-sorting protein